MRTVLVIYTYYYIDTLCLSKISTTTQGAHYDAANFLLRRYDVLILPKLSTGQMVQKDSRVFGSKVARSMCTMSHGLFSQRMESAASR